MGFEYYLILKYGQSESKSNEDEVVNLLKGISKMGSFIRINLRGVDEELNFSEVLEHFKKHPDDPYVGEGFSIGFSFNFKSSLDCKVPHKEYETWGYFYPSLHTEKKELRLNAASRSMIRIDKEWDNSETFLKVVLELIAKVTKCQKVALWNDMADPEEYEMEYPLKKK